MSYPIPLWDVHEREPELVVLDRAPGTDGLRQYAWDSIRDEVIVISGPVVLIDPPVKPF